MITLSGFALYMLILLLVYMTLGYALTRALNPKPYTRRTIAITDDTGHTSHVTEVV